MRRTNHHGFRAIKCNLHGKIFYGKGTTRVLHKIVFTFCESCWLTRRDDCDDHMKRVVFGTPAPFRLAPDPEMNANQPTKIWLDNVTKRMHAVFQENNTYSDLRRASDDLLAFGTASIVLPKPERKEESS
jgi:hypothetical protein